MIINASQGENELMYVREFIIMGFPGPPERQIFFFVIFLLIYLTSIVANITIIGLVWLNRHLHTPMYFFLGNYSFLEVLYISTAIPKLLNMFLSDNHTIPFAACIAQLYIFTTVGTTDVFFLAVMSCDRYLAICYPLRYPSIMSFKFCIYLVLGCWLMGMLFTSCPLFLVATLPFCGPNIIDHFLCESAPLFELACSDTTFIKTIFSIVACTMLISSFVFIMVSYTSVIVAIVKMPSAKGKQKAFSTVTSHLTVVLIFFITVGVMHISPSEKDPLRNKAAALCYGILTPCLNPFIYSLRNKDMKEAFRNVAKMNKDWTTSTSIFRVAVHE